MRKILLFFTIFCFLLPLQPSHARDLHGRLGVGYNGQFQPSENDDFFNRANAISLKYGLMKGVAVAAVFGASTSSPVSTVAALNSVEIKPSMIQELKRVIEIF